MKIDLHCHSTASDGELHPEELIEYAHQMNIDVLSLTDHDTVAGIADAAFHAEKFGIHFIPGIELEAYWPDGHFHILGYHIDPYSSVLADHLKRVQQDRINRNQIILEKMNSAGIKAELHDIHPGEGIVGRPHFAGFLKKIGYVDSLDEAFASYLGEGGAFYKKREAPSIEEVCSAIKAAGGYPVIAHPKSLGINLSEFRQLLPKLKERGIDGVECFHSGVKKSRAKRFRSMTLKSGLFVTGGSDFHRKGQEKFILGRSSGNMIITKRLVQGFPLD
jgi:predicted metal-dependent phosphoesterase TrpH